MPAVASTEVFHRSEGIACARCGPIWVMILSATPTAERMRMAGPTLTAMKAAYPSGFATITYILPSAGVMMDAAAREAAAETTRAHADVIRIIANVVEGTGFTAATVRAVLSGLHLLTRLQTPERTFASGEQAFEWIVRLREVKIDEPERLGRELTALRAELGGTPPN
jgi:hypothetical protein